MKQFLIESCCDSVEKALSAEKRGAGRIELCSDLSVGGITPLEEDILQAVESLSIPVNVLIRPRGGNFVFGESEIAQMMHSIAFCRELKTSSGRGVHGVVIGALTPEGDVDVDTMERLNAVAGPLSVTFHRAFDVCSNPFEALEVIIDLGCDRILTSGHEPDAFAGKDTIARLVQQAAGRIIIMPGRGVRPDNLATIAAVTGATEFHGTALP